MPTITGTAELMDPETGNFVAEINYAAHFNYMGRLEAIDLITIRDGKEVRRELNTNGAARHFDTIMYNACARDAMGHSPRPTTRAEYQADQRKTQGE